MTTILHPSPVPTPSTSAPPTPPYPAFPRLPHASSASPSIHRNDSTSSTTTTSSTTSSLVAAPMRPPPIETRTAATSTSTPIPPVSSQMTGRGSARGMMRNGLRMARQGSMPAQPKIATSADPALDDMGAVMPEISASMGPGSKGRTSPTTPRAARCHFPERQEGPLRVTVSLDPMAKGSSLSSPRGRGSGPPSPILQKGKGKERTLSPDIGAGAGGHRERRQSQASATSSGSTGGAKKHVLSDFVLGEELGRGSYSVVHQAVMAANAMSPTSPKPPRQYALKIINQGLLIQEKKVKYALIERDCLIKLNMPNPSAKNGKVHRRGMSSSSAANVAINTGPTKQRSNASITSNNGISGPKERLNIQIVDSPDLSLGAPLSPTIASTLAGRRPSRSAEPPAMVAEGEEVQMTEEMRSKPPSAVLEESSVKGSPPNRDRDRDKSQAPDRRRRQSLAPSERSLKSGRSSMVAHPGVIRLFSTFNDSTSLYFVLELAGNGELLGAIRKYGSLDVTSARFYAAQLIDTIEFMHGRGVIHRDLKPENILLDEDMRIKITDFGSAKLINDNEAPDESTKRSFVGSADFVSPEVLRNEPAVPASDIWAYGCILHQMICGKPPFRAATDYLTFQRILKKEMEFAEGYDAEARSLVDLVLNLEPASRPTIAEIKSHPFFSSVDFSTIWTIPAPPISTGLTRPVTTLANVDLNSDIWAVFDDNDEVSDGGFGLDDDELPSPLPNPDAPRLNGTTARNAIASVTPSVQFPSVRRSDSASSLEPPKPAWMSETKRKSRGWSQSQSSTSHRTSSSSSANRTALTGLLETMGIHNLSGSGFRGGSSRTSRTSERSDEVRVLQGQGRDEADAKWSSLLLSNERIILSTPINVKTPSSVPVPAFLLPAPKRRQLILTDFPRLISVKEDEMKIKSECVFVVRPSTGTGGSAAGSGYSGGGDAGGANRVMDVVEKGNKGFMVQTLGQSYVYMADSTEGKARWLEALRKVVG